MLISRICCQALAPITRTSRIQVLLIKPSSVPKQVYRTFAEEARNSFRERLAKRRSLKERLMAPAGQAAFNYGKGALVGGAALGIGSLCFYGLGLSSQTGAIDNSVLWPAYVKERVRTTYTYFGSCIAVTACSAAACFRSPFMMHLVTKNSFTAIAVSVAAMMGSGMIVRSLPYQEGFGTKQIAWLAHAAIMGTAIAPICFLGGPIILRAAWYTLGVVGGLSTVAICAPSGKFLALGGPLGIGLGVILASAVGSMFFPPSTALGAGLYSISLYGGLLLFSGFLLYDTQRIIRAAETCPLNGSNAYDPINESLSIYMDTLNIFMRIAVLLAGGGGSNRRK